MTIVFSICMLAGFGAVPFFVFAEAIEKGNLELNVATVAAFILLWLFLGGIAAIIRWVKVISFDEDQEILTIWHPFLLQTRRYHFTEIVGFQWAYVNGKVGYKSLKLKASDGRTFQFLDFEIGNFREIEGLITHLFVLRVSKNWKLATPREKALEEQKSKNFDFEQAEDIRWYLRYCLGGALISILVHLYVLYEGGSNFNKGSGIFITMILAFTFAVLVKYKEINRVLNK
ncbi:hypothetical protein ACD591_18185 [Rufibacter glacialis]|uniref:Uncharacterized protein n=1 Tax=Rufibacter glacialis TaxID=1259555 RepID=A0A5M8Q830_9BACT|nr:hypothetical protein [Rufibacter glacialis]KAA6430772.1 hypothetical protein FOE74_20105 [Rufibacter glacialis]